MCIMISEKINKTAEKETISNCKRAARRALQLRDILENDHPISFLFFARHSVRKNS